MLQTDYLTTYHRSLQMYDSGCNGTGPDLRLPVPPEAARKHSLTLAGLIREQISRCGGHISFERFMEMALYEPGWGYYSAGAARFGEAGDFVTAPHVSSLFSRCVARQCRQVLAAIPAGVILETGAGSGLMAVDVLQELEALGSMPEHYFILETSADLRSRQEQLFASRIPHLRPRIAWLETLPEQPLSGIIIANEVIDAMPVARVALDNGVLHELCVGHDGDEFYWVRTPAPDGPVRASWDRIASGLPGPLPEPFETELGLRVAAWVRSVSALLEQGAMLLIDYGYPGYEFYHPQRDRGTLLCHYRHRSHDNPFCYPGLQDITASVDFTALARAGLDNGLQLAGYTSQAHFLIGCGITEMAAALQNGKDCPDPAVTAQVKRLTMPGEMGERFKAIAFTREFPETLVGFRFLDQQDRLWRQIK